MSWLSSVGNFVGGLFSSGGGNSGNNAWGDIFKALLGGIGGSADAKLTAEMYVKKAEAEGLEQRKSSLFEMELLDYAKQKDKVRKRAALDTYGQFSQISRWAPNYVSKNPALEQVAKPNPNMPGGG